MHQIKYNKRDQKTYLILGANSYIFWPIFREFIKNNLWSVLHVLDLRYVVNQLPEDGTLVKSACRSWY